MAQRNPDDKNRFEQALQLVKELSPDDQVQLVAELQRQWLVKELEKGEDDLANGRSLTGEEVLARLRESNKKADIQ